MDILTTLLRELKPRMEGKEPLIVAIDGRCGAGKTTLAQAMADSLPCQVIHMDDFFLRPEQRTAQRLAQPGENVDHERFLEEVLLPLSRGEPVFYRPYHCGTQTLGRPIALTYTPLILIEGSYSCHPRLWEYYDLHIFLTVSEETQLRRIEKRGGKERLAQFRSRWIPLEERYFAAFHLERRCELVLSTDN